MSRNLSLGLAGRKLQVTLYVCSTRRSHEAEELLAFYQFAEDVYDGIFDDIEVEVHPDNPRFREETRPPTPDGVFVLDNSCKSLHCLYVSLRLITLYTRLPAELSRRNHAARRS